MKKGQLIRVEIKPGRIVKMYKEDAIKEGLIPDYQKMKKPVENKMLIAESNKGEIIKDDFTVIPGIGSATAESLYNQGIETFEDLKKFDLSNLTPSARRAVEKYFEKID